MKDKDLIKFNGVSFKYDDESGKMVLDGINLQIERGDFVAVLGYNGSGKSTLAKHMNAILLPTAGKVTVDGMDTADEQHIFDIRQKVGMVFQNPDNQIVATIVEEDVAFAPENMGLERGEIVRRVDESLAAVDMTKHRLDAPHKLSGGQKQRVAIAGVLAMRPECLVLDEPTAMLDPIGRRRVLRTVGELNRTQGMTVVLITHYMEEAAAADRVVVLDAGKVALDGTPKQVFGDAEKIRKLGLDVPQVTDLCCRLRDAGIDIAADITGTDECVETLAALLQRAGK